MYTKSDTSAPYRAAIAVSWNLHPKWRRHDHVITWPKLRDNSKIEVDGRLCLPLFNQSEPGILDYSLRYDNNDNDKYHIITMIILLLFLLQFTAWWPLNALIFLIATSLQTIPLSRNRLNLFGEPFLLLMRSTSPQFAYETASFKTFNLISDLLFEGQRFESRTFR